MLSVAWSWMQENDVKKIGAKKKKKISKISLLLLLPFGCHWQLEGEAQVHAVHISHFFSQILLITRRKEKRSTHSEEESGIKTHTKTGEPAQSLSSQLSCL